MNILLVIEPQKIVGTTITLIANVTVCTSTFIFSAFKGAADIALLEKLYNCLMFHRLP
jgi:hypothetical protein